MSKRTISVQAYAKAVLHCAKYPWATVHGLLLSEKKDGKVRYVDAIPLAHTWTHLTPMFDVALQQVQLYAKANGLSIGGYYVAHEDVSATQLPEFSALLAKTILGVSDDVVAFVIDAKKLAPESNEPGIIPYVNTDSQWKAVPAGFATNKGGSAEFALENNRVLATAKRLVAERAEVAIHDFDEHLDDVTLDWLQNPLLNERIRTA
ncbi:UPF0172-domain-containing protein [Coemansia reversa NRRL 1564]|uniref:UPF0172-domain-containing protein n=1 Tax=Coemansia reversa (strain ATCC 12441 / NRRL 1564) TaxID=763665 RepID=A0A2G5BKW9_COERN|nr:UPF0172-domain-containing protein [Coemansia reversa NRRL 1564]|eukprot:PIA19650.1 UPF0172-domain-containing protein [Coemansia reversa NRRL 1564]